MDKGLLKTQGVCQFIIDGGGGTDQNQQRAKVQDKVSRVQNVVMSPACAIERIEENNPKTRVRSGRITGNQVLPPVSSKRRVQKVSSMKLCPNR